MPRKSWKRPARSSKLFNPAKSCVHEKGFEFSKPFFVITYPAQLTISLHLSLRAKRMSRAKRGESNLPVSERIASLFVTDWKACPTVKLVENVERAISRTLSPRVCHLWSAVRPLFHRGLLHRCAPRNDILPGNGLVRSLKENEGHAIVRHHTEQLWLNLCYPHPDKILFLRG